MFSLRILTVLSVALSLVAAMDGVSLANDADAVVGGAENPTILEPRTYGSSNNGKGNGAWWSPSYGFGSKGSQGSKDGQRQASEQKASKPQAKQQNSKPQQQQKKQQKDHDQKKSSSASSSNAKSTGSKDHSGSNPQTKPNTQDKAKVKDPHSKDKSTSPKVNTKTDPKSMKPKSGPTTTTAPNPNNDSPFNSNPIADTPSLTSEAPNTPVAELNSEPQPSLKPRKVLKKRLDDIPVALLAEHLCPKDLYACPIGASAPTATPRNSRKVTYGPIDNGTGEGMTAQPCSTGVPGSLEEWVRRGFECVDRKVDLSACGGCATLDIKHDCTAIPGVDSVSCEEGVCQVHSCRVGYAFDASTGTCNPAASSSTLSRR